MSNDDLEIPDRALDIAYAIDDSTDGLRAAAPVVVAAELRRIAKQGRNVTTTQALCTYLQQRADQLDPPHLRHAHQP